MSDNSPRWPGANGSPGLDFSPYRKSGSKDTAVVEEELPTQTVSEAKKQQRSGAGVKKTASSAAGKKPAAPAAAATATLNPSLTERAANTAKEWAATPVGPGATAKTADSKPVDVTAPAEPIDMVAPPAPPVVEAIGEDTAQPLKEPKAGKNRRTRKARLRLSRIDPWSVMKTTFLFAIAFGVMLVVAVFVIWSVLSGSGALEAVNTLVNSLQGDVEGGSTFKLEDILNTSRVLGFATVVAAIDVVIITAVATLFAFLYNLSATVMGGLEVTLAED